jgi:hypothetical protein
MEVADQGKIRSLAVLGKSSELESVLQLPWQNDLKNHTGDDVSLRC